MISGPYQSNVLRFLIRQYRQGISRHAKAVCQTRSTVSFGIGVGATVALLPVYAAVCASQSTTQTLKQVIEKRLSRRRLFAKGGFGFGEKAKKLLDFSDFDPLAVQFLRGLEPEADQCVEPACFDNSAIVHSETAIMQTLVTVGRYLFPSQVDDLLGDALPQENLSENKLTGSGVRFSTSRFVALGRRCLNWIVRRTETVSLLRREAVLITSADASVDRKYGLITGVASDVVTRSLVLVQDHIKVWNGLTPEQQRKLHSQISRFLSGRLLATSALQQKPEKKMLETGTALISRPLLNSIQSFQIPVTSTVATITSTLVRPIHSVWVAVLQVFAEFPRPWRTHILAVLPPGQKQLPRKTLFTLKQLKTIQVSALPESCLGQFTLLVRNTHPPLQMTCDERAKSSPVIAAEETGSLLKKAPTAVEYRPSFLEADVISIDYVEHPFERILQWIDRIFLWIEEIWQVWTERLKHWLSR